MHQPGEPHLRGQSTSAVGFPLKESYWWTPRRAQMVTGGVLVALAITSFFVDWTVTSAIYMNLAKQAIYIVAGVVIYWIGEVWSSDWKRPFGGLLSVALVALGILAFVIGGQQESNLGFTHLNRPWEALLYLAGGIWHGITVWWPRRFDDYEWATGTSSGRVG